MAAHSPFSTPFTRHTGVAVPLIGGPMSPCSNPELVAAVSEAGGIGVVQPVSLTYVHGHEYREGLRYIRRLTAKPIGFNALIEASSKLYHVGIGPGDEIGLDDGEHELEGHEGGGGKVCEKAHA